MTAASVSRAILLAVVVLGSARDTSAQGDRWSPWLGCWDRISQETLESLTPAGAAAEIDTITRSAPRVCVASRTDGGVTITTSVGDQAPVEQVLVPDGVARPVSQNGCQGTERTEWSSSGRRLYSIAEITCGDGQVRTVSGLALLTNTDEWLDIRSFQVDEWPTTRVTRYGRAEKSIDRPLSSANSPLTVNEIKEASSKVTSSVLEAAIAETNPRLPVNGKTLVDLADASVPPQVIDVIVALAYPEKFLVERVDRTAPADVYYSADDVFYYPAYYYSPFVYGYIGSYPPLIYGPGGGGVIRPIRPDDLASGRARAINTQGYTRIRANDAPSHAVPRGRGPDTAMPSSASRSMASDSDGPPPGGAPSGDSSGGSQSGGASASSGGGFSRGGGGGDTGRTAQPR
jgi:uncharacterized membrane protein YgcG